MNNMKDVKKRRTVKINVLFGLIIIFVFLAIAARLSFVSLSDVVDGVNIEKFALARNTTKETLYANRGTIYDKYGEVLATNVNSYTVVAYLDSSRTVDKDKPRHVIDKADVAKKLSPIINMSEETIMKLLNQNLYQVELGPGGRGISELKKEAIEDLCLPGIGFTKSIKRYYPKSTFMSYTLGYAKTNEDTDNIVGEMGLELYYNDILSGENGSKEYQKDLLGYQIASVEPIVKESEDGSDVFLTIDTNIQYFVEQEINKIGSTSKTEWASIAVVNAKTGAILGVSSYPTFDPNKKDMSIFYDPFVSYTYEPGSTMKSFSFLAAMENNLYDGNEKYKSGRLEIDDTGNYVEDWNLKGWGTITFDEGYVGSSNVAAALLGEKLGKDKLKEFYEKLGFSYKTGITLPNELAGSLPFNYKLEVANASFGQALTATPVQIVQAYTLFANDGEILKPYIVEKIVNSDGKVTYQGEKTVVDKVASKENVDYMKELMHMVVNGGASTSYAMIYNVAQMSLIGKTGTAQIASSNGGYQTGGLNVIRSFVGLFPKDDPEVIIYIALSKTSNTQLISNITRSLVTNVGTYLGINKEDIQEEKIVTLKSFVNKSAEESEKQLEENKLKAVVISDGETVISQYPKNSYDLNINEKVFLLTNGKNITLPNMNSWSKADVENYALLTKANFTYEGYGYVTSTSFKENEPLDLSKTYEIKLSS